jgi:hypothetical protein
MEKREVQYVVIALAVVIILALVIKPVLTGKPANLGVQASTTPIATATAGSVPPPAAAMTSANQSIGSVVSTINGSSPPAPSGLPYASTGSNATIPGSSLIGGIVTPIVTPTSTRGVVTPIPGVSQIPFVDPSRYSVQLVETLPDSNHLAPAPTEDPSLRTYAQISGRWSGTTDVIRIPYPSFELHYTLTPSVQPDIVMPRFSIQVVDADDPNRFVRIVSPPGNTYSGSFSERFYEGNHRYYFIITSRYIQSYTIEVKVPEKYPQA